MASRVNDLRSFVLCMAPRHLIRIIHRRKYIFFQTAGIFKASDNSVWFNRSSEGTCVFYQSSFGKDDVHNTGMCNLQPSDTYGLQYNTLMVVVFYVANKRSLNYH